MPQQNKLVNSNVNTQIVLSFVLSAISIPIGLTMFTDSDFGGGQSGAFLFYSPLLFGVAAITLSAVGMSKLQKKGLAIISLILAILQLVIPASFFVLLWYSLRNGF